MEAFQALFKSPDVAKLINGYNQPKTVNTIGTCFSLYVKDVWKNNYGSLAFPFYTALAQHPSCVFNTQTQLEKLSDAVFVSEQKLKLNFTSIEWACLMERYGDKSIYSLEILSNISEPGSTFFIQTTLDWIIRNQNAESPEIINLILTTLGSVNASLPRSTSTLLDFPSLKSSPRLPAYTESLDSLLHIALYKHGAPLTKVGSFLDSYGTFEKLCYYDHRHQNKFGLTALMMCAMKGWKTFAVLLNKIFLDPKKISESARLEYFNLKDNLGRTALDYAVLYPEMQEYLKSIGCVSSTPITVSANNSNLLGGIKNYKTHPDYNQYPPLWLETFYGDTQAVQSTTLDNIQYNYLSVDSVNSILKNTDNVGYFGIPFHYEFGIGLNTYPQDLAIITGNVEMYSIWNKKLYTETGQLKPEITVGPNPSIEVVLDYNPNISRAEATLIYLNTQERNNTTVFANEKVMTQYLEFLYSQVDKNRFIKFLIMKEYCLNQTNKDTIESYCQKYKKEKKNLNIQDQEYNLNWTFNICSNIKNNLFDNPKIQRFPAPNQSRFCTSCYSFAVMAMVDINMSIILDSFGLPIYKQNDRSGIQSYQMPLSCAPTGDCIGGGNIKLTLEWHQENYSIPLECMPYVSWKYVKEQQEAGKPIENGGKLAELCPLSNPSDCVKKAIKITSDPNETYRVTDMSAMIERLNLGYALVGAMRLPSNFPSFTGGNKVYSRGTGGWLADSDVYNSVTNPYLAQSSFHIIVIIGYGELDGLKYWILLNSWGEQYESPFGEKDENGKPKMVPYCLVLRGTDDVWIESSGAYYTIPLLRNDDGTTSNISPETWPLK